MKIIVRIRETKGGELRKMQRRSMKGRDKIKWLKARQKVLERF